MSTSKQFYETIKLCNLGKHRSSDLVNKFGNCFHFKIFSASSNKHKNIEMRITDTEFLHCKSNIWEYCTIK